MDLFYRLLWRHVFAVELIRRRYQIYDQRSQSTFLEDVIKRFWRDKRKQDAIQYLQQFGEEFWLESEYRVQEITKKMEGNLKSTIGTKLSSAIPYLGNSEATISVDRAKNLSEEERGEIVQRGQDVVNKVQMDKLSHVMRLLENDLLDDKQKQYYIIIDRLDENWVHDNFRYHLIRSLIDTIREFNHTIENVKIIVAVREDLLDRVFRFARSAGYQEEKYRSMYLPLSWTSKELNDLLNKRVNQIVREQYTNQQVKLSDLFPNSIDRKDPLKYFFDRTLYRPRDAIMFFNQCIQSSEGKAKFTKGTISQAEVYYSEDRLRALADEWAADYPNLIEMCLFLKKYPSRFNISRIREDINEKVFEFLSSKPAEDEIYQLAMTHFENDSIDEFVLEMLKILYKVGIVGIKPNTYSSVQWSHYGQKLSRNAIDDDASIQIHPAFWRTFGIKPI